MKSNYLAAALLNLRRGTDWNWPATVYVAMLKVTHGARANSTAYALDNTICLTIGGRQVLYKCTTAGTTASSQPGGYVGAANEAITDGTAVFTEQTSGLQAGTACVEPTGGSYARVSVTSNTSNWGAASAGSGGYAQQIQNAASFTWPQASAAWTTGSEAIWAEALYDAATNGNLLEVWPLQSLVQVSLGSTPADASASVTVSEN